MKIRISTLSCIGSAVFIFVLLTTLVTLASGQDAEAGTTQRRRGRRNRQRDGNGAANGGGGNGGGGRRRGGGRRGGRQGGRDRYSRYGCEEIYLPMCKGLVGYTHTKLPNQFNHTTQEEVYRELDMLWPYIDHSCSKNTRIVACAKYLPKCHGRRPAMLPCKKTCMQAKKKCGSTLSDLMGLDWAEKFECRDLPNRRCVRPVRDQRCPYDYTNCVENSALSVCANLTFTWGTMPNMFGQCFVEELNTEIQFYNELMATNCHDHLKFFLCGVYSPFCIRSESPFTFPCKELCEEVRTACEPHYRRLYHNLPWPQKLQCHRYPDSENEHYDCVLPNEGLTFRGGK